MCWARGCLNHLSPTSSQELANAILHTVYLGTVNSSVATKNRATNLSKQIGGYHYNLVIDTIVAAVVGVFTTITGKTPQFLSKVWTPAIIALDLAQSQLVLNLHHLYLYRWD